MTPVNATRVQSRRAIVQDSQDDAMIAANMLETIAEFWDFLRQRKKFWLLPIVLVLGGLGGLVVLTQGSAIAPFIYTLF
jgi:hypothetical protein